MKKTTLFFGMLVAVMFAFIILTTNTLSAQAKAKPWPVPAADKSVKSPVNLKDAAVITAGNELWTKSCKSCHGVTGLGDGPKAAAINTLPGNFTTKEFQQATDGELFYWINTGREDMPGFGKKIPDVANIWALVAYIRTLKK